MLKIDNKMGLSLSGLTKSIRNLISPVQVQTPVLAISKEELENILLVGILNEINYFERFDTVLECNVGDPTYYKLLEMIQERRDDRLFYEQLLFEAEFPADMREFVIRKYCKDECSDPTPREIQSHVSTIIVKLAILKFTKDLDYSDQLKEQLISNLDSLPELTSFKGLPFYMFSSHRHSGKLIRDYVKRSKEPVTIVRLDCHNDFRTGRSGKEAGENYMDYVLRDPEVAERITQVITVSYFTPSKRTHLTRDEAKEEEYPGFDCVCYIIHGVPFYKGDIFRMPYIEGPALVDIDLDGLEKVIDTMPRGQGTYDLDWAGGCFGYPRGLNNILPTFLQDNQNLIRIHPVVAANILKERIKNPRQIYLATERGYRNRMFRYMIEYDFLRALAE